MLSAVWSEAEHTTTGLAPVGERLKHSVSPCTTPNRSPRLKGCESHLLLSLMSLSCNCDCTLSVNLASVL